MVGPIRRPSVIVKKKQTPLRAHEKNLNGAAAVHRIVIVIIRAHAPFSLPKIESTLQVSNQLTSACQSIIIYYLRGHGPTVTLAAAGGEGRLYTSESQQRQQFIEICGVVLSLEGRG